MSTGEPAVMANKRFTLSPEQLRAFSDQGLLKVDFGFDPQLLDQIITEVRPLYGTAYEEDPLAAIRCQDGWKEVDAVRQLAVHDSVLAALRMLMDREPLPFQTLNFPVGTSQYSHSDSIHFHTIPAGFMVGVWVALEDIDAENGPLIYYPGSHKLPYYSMQDLGLGPGYSNYHAYELRIQDLIAEHGLQSELGLLERGEAIIWHANLLHGGADRKDITRSRHSQVTHYFFENCRYYTPMESRPGKLCYRKPFRIPSQPDFSLPPDLSTRSLPVRAVGRLLRSLGLRN